MRCPKCDEEQDRAEACRRCGLASDRFDSYASEAAGELPPELEEAWRRCLGAWRDSSVHEALVERIAAASAFAPAARRYRAYLRDNPGDERASEQLERIGRMAQAAAFTAASTSSRTGGEREPYRAVLWLLAVFGLLAVGGALYALLTREARELGPDLEAPIELRGQPPIGRDAPSGRR
jgi:hypothetical protein